MTAHRALEPVPTPPEANRRQIPAPRGLGRAGAALWRKITTAFELDERELSLLEAAARQAQIVADLEAVVAAAPSVMVAGSAGQAVLHPAIAEARQGRVVLSRLLGQLDLPADGGDPPPAGGTPAATVRSQRARHAAQARWAAQPSRGR